MARTDRAARLTQQVDLSNCEREPIHIPGRVQSFGALVAVSSDWIVRHVSANVAEFLETDPEQALGTPLAEFARPEAIRAMQSRVQFLRGGDSVERLFGLVLRAGGPLVDVAVHGSGGSIVLEFEFSPADGAAEHLGHVRPMIDRIAEASTIDDACAIAARQVRALTGFDRVMVYRFGADDSGSVIAESTRAGLEPYLGLRYPASDIPRQARELYRRNLLRLIADVNDEGHVIEPMLSPEGAPLDLSMSTLRAVSPIHLEYLRNMGVGASMSISILDRGRLWGLIACHHMRPRALPYGTRTAAELFAQLFGLLIDQKRGDLERMESVRARLLHDRLMLQIAGGSSIADNIDMVIEGIGSLIAHDGAVGWIDGEFTATGHTPTREEFLGLVRFLNRTAASQIYHTDSIIGAYPAGEGFSDRASGMLVLPVSRSPRDYIVLFRREVARSVQWAGNPEKPVEMGPNGIRLTPRKSFEAWKEVVRDSSEPWTALEVQAAESLRVTLLEVVLRMTDATLREREKAQERQEVLIAELNHRVRNILNLIRSLINQSRGDARSVSDFTQVVGGRIHALARAHDQVTQERWSPASLHDLIRTEAEAYLAGKADRVAVAGPEALLEPTAFTVLALVIHEMMTNAVKYGALSDSSGRIAVDVSVEEDGAVLLTWRESGGPAISATPTRRGFGSTIIDRSIPFELKGQAEVHYETGGLRAAFRIPERYVAEVVEGGRQEPGPTSPSDEITARLHGAVLVLEDNMIIALDAEDMMREFGATEVHVATTVAEALAAVEGGGLTFALLDVNLGDETSQPVARRLRELGVPFVFATGYGETSPLTQEFPGTHVVVKPYDAAKLEQAISAR